MPGLKLLVLTDEPERFRGALLLALTMRALGRDVSIFLQLEAVELLTGAAPRDSAHQAAGLPSLKELIAETLASGVAIAACQTGLHLMRQDAEKLDPRITTGGLLSFLSSMPDEDRLVTV